RTTTMLPGADGNLAPAMMVQEHRTHGANDSVDSQKTTSLSDLEGKWQVSEVKSSTTREGADHGRTTDERVSRPDADGRLGEISGAITKESEDGGEKRSTVETYSADVPGSTRDGSLHPVERSTTVQKLGGNGQQTTQHAVERPDPGDPGAGLRVSI